MLPMYAHGLSLMQPPTPAYVRKVVSPTDSRPLPTLLTAVRQEGDKRVWTLTHIAKPLIH